MARYWLTCGHLKKKLKKSKKPRSDTWHTLGLTCAHLKKN